MSHLICPLCGKNAPLSTLDPEGLDLDVKVVSFKGLGYGRGFAKSEEHSILGDGEYCPQLARRSLQLCRMFINAGVIQRDVVEKTLNIDTTKEYLNQINELRKQINTSNYSYRSLQNQIREINEGNELNDQVDYIIREGVEFTKPEDISADSEGWYLNMTPDNNNLELYLYLVAQELPAKLKNRLLPHIKSDKDPYWYEVILKDVARKKSMLELLLDEGREGVIHHRDKDGIMRELRWEAVSLMNQDDNPISLKDVKNIVSDTKNLLKGPYDEYELKKRLGLF